MRRLAVKFACSSLQKHIQNPIEHAYSLPKSDFIRNIDILGHTISNGVIVSSINIITRIFLLIVILIWLLSENFVVTCFIVIIFVSYYFTVASRVKKYISNASKLNFKIVSNLNKTKIDIYDSLRFIKLSKLDQVVVDKYKVELNDISRRLANVSILGDIPKFALEAIALVILIVSSLYLSDKSSWWTGSMAILGISAYRVIPAMQQIYRATNNIQQAKAVSKEIFFALKNPPDLPEDTKSLEKLSKLVLVDLSYKHSNSTKEMHFGSLEIPLSGINIIIGKSGTGKSTLFDILMGLREPTSGSILIDNNELHYVRRQWWERISYVGQTPIFIGGNVLDYITYGENFYSEPRLEAALEASGLMDVCNERSLLSSNTNVSDLCLSGGEMCRLSIARALYKQSQVVFLDEPFSALDMNSARLISSSFRKFYKDRCFIIISHRFSEIGYHDKLYNLDKKDEQNT